MWNPILSLNLLHLLWRSGYDFFFQILVIEPAFFFFFIFLFADSHTSRWLNYCSKPCSNIFIFLFPFWCSEYHRLKEQNLCRCPKLKSIVWISADPLHISLYFVQNLKIVGCWLFAGNNHLEKTSLQQPSHTTASDS